MEKYNTIIWDWNGTLLNDAWLGIEVMNSLLNERKLPLLTLEKYREIFDFPVKDYYAKLGFNFEKEPFEVIGNEFITRYDQKHLSCSLHENALEMLNYIKNAGLKQYVLSARNHVQLENEFDHFGIRFLFESFSGLSDNLANGKIELGRQLIENHKIDQQKTLMIGDTVHDFEVSAELGIDCILYTGGHQSEKRLSVCNTLTINNLIELKHYLNG